MYKIALLDDNYEFCIVMECFLSNFFDISTFTNTNKFLKSIESELYDLVLVDFSIIPCTDVSIQDGCELIEHLQKTLTHPPLLILVTGWIGRNPAKEGKKICPTADGFLAKDSGIEEILPELNRLLTAKSTKH